jgi:hypothetical protein
MSFNLNRHAGRHADRVIIRALWWKNFSSLLAPLEVKIAKCSKLLLGEEQ